jgi:hypothetical protein
MCMFFFLLPMLRYNSRQTVEYYDNNSETNIRLCLITTTMLCVALQIFLGTYLMIYVLAIN